MTAERIGDARYFGSVTTAHGRVTFVDDCVCPDCVLLEPWDPVRRFVLWVVPDAIPDRTVHLVHVRHESFVGWR